MGRKRTFASGQPQECPLWVESGHWLFVLLLRVLE
jgi:hypothetical protein